MEGDGPGLGDIINAFIFLSTPSGWRATAASSRRAPQSSAFLSTPSGWRATSYPAFIHKDFLHFYPRPPGGGRPTNFFFRHRFKNFYPRPPGGGRPLYTHSKRLLSLFLSTPSGWRATYGDSRESTEAKISIHALRVEGDYAIDILNRLGDAISIHALRVEGDSRS